MPIDHRRIDAFLAASGMRFEIAQVVRQAGFQVVWVHDSAAPNIWGLNLKLNRHLRDLFGTSREVLLWVAEYPDFQARTVMRAAEVIEANQPRVSEDLAIVFTGDPDTENAVKETSETLRTSFVGFSFDEVRSFFPHGSRDFLNVLQSKFFTRDLYWISTAIISPSAFFGRQALIPEITADLRTCRSHVGVFGLRKMGKTSLLYRVLDALRNTSEVRPVHVDVQRVDAIEPTGEYLLWTLAQQLFDSSSQIRRISGLRLMGMTSTYAEARARVSIQELFGADVDCVMRSTRLRLVFLLDEIELMFPGLNGSRWDAASFIGCWRLLRGLTQQYPGRISFFVTGTNPTCIETGRIEGVDNPIYNFFDRRFLAPLTHDEAKDLLESLGARMGLEWEDEAIELLIGRVGAHPFLMRAYASRIHRSLLPRESRQTVATDTVQSRLEPFLSEFSSALSQMIEVLADEYPDEYEILKTLALGRIGEYQELCRAFPEDTAHLVGYGLIPEDVHDSRVLIEVLQTWIQRREQQRSSLGEPRLAGRLEAGTRIEDYEVLASIGHPGGFADVYRARRCNEPDSGDVALKVFRAGSFAALQREVDVISRLNHPNVVHIEDYGRTADGVSFLAMEYLDGPTLRSYCHRSGRLEGAKLRAVIVGLLDALRYLHPDEETIAKLRAKAELSSEEFEELSRARHGYVHRDVKPENVVLVEGRGPVLIDFNISVRVADPVRTVSATRGYLPPDGVSGSWNSDVDLFAAGVTLLQVASGIEFDGENLADLRGSVERELPLGMASVLLKLTEEQGSNRFPSAVHAIRALG